MTYEITVPILNEAFSLERQIEIVVKYINESLSDIADIRVIIADNGSTDASPEIGHRLAEKHATITYLRLDEQGVGRALKQSWEQSKADFVGYMDLDLATDLRHIREAFDLLADGADVVTGSRLAPGAQVIGRSVLREVTSRAFNFIVTAYFGTHFGDGMCGFKFVRRANVEPLIEMGAASDGWFFATEFLVCAEKAGLRVETLPVKWTDDPESKAKIVQLTFEYLGAMRRLKERLKH